MHALGRNVSHCSWFTRKCASCEAFIINRFRVRSSAARCGSLPACCRAHAAFRSAPPCAAYPLYVTRARHVRPTHHASPPAPRPSRAPGPRRAARLVTRPHKSKDIPYGIGALGCKIFRLCEPKGGKPARASVPAYAQARRSRRFPWWQVELAAIAVKQHAPITHNRKNLHRPEGFSRTAFQTLHADASAQRSPAPHRVSDFSARARRSATERRSATHSRTQCFLPAVARGRISACRAALRFDGDARGRDTMAAYSKPLPRRPQWTP